MNSIKATRAHQALKAALRDFTDASRRLESIATALHVGEAGMDADARQRAVETLVTLDRQLQASRRDIAALASVVFDDVVANRDLLPPVPPLPSAASKVRT